MDATTSLNTLLTSYPVEVKTLTYEAIKLLENQLPGSKQVIDMPARLVGFVYGPGYKGTVCSIVLSKKGIKIGFFGSAHLPDPEHLLTGTGKTHRHVQINTAIDLQKPGLFELVEEARKQCLARLAL